jgi:hypothetical protein
MPGDQGAACHSILDGCDRSGGAGALALLRHSVQAQRCQRPALQLPARALLPPQLSSLRSPLAPAPQGDAGAAPSCECLAVAGRRPQAGMLRQRDQRPLRREAGPQRLRSSVEAALQRQVPPLAHRCAHRMQTEGRGQCVAGAACGAAPLGDGCPCMLCTPQRAAAGKGSCGGLLGPILQGCGSGALPRREQRCSPETSQLGGRGGSAGSFGGAERGVRTPGRQQPAVPGAHRGDAKAEGAGPQRGASLPLFHEAAPR